jgi:hypothetical protein
MQTTKEQLIDIMKSVPNNGLSNYLSRRNPHLKQEIFNETSFLIKSATFMERVFVIVNDITKDDIICNYCNKNIPDKTKFRIYDITKEDYLRIFCGRSCSRKWQLEYQKQNELSDIDYSLSVMNINELAEFVNNNPYQLVKNNKEIINSIKVYFENQGISYTDRSFREILYIVKNKLGEIPKCPVCGNTVSFNSTKFYATHCSPKCAGSVADVDKKRKQTVNDKYGVDNVMHINITKEKIATTNLEKYGVVSIFQREDIIKNNIKLANQRAFNNFSRFSKTIIPMFTIDEFIGCGYDKEYKWFCKLCDKEFVAWYNNGDLPRCIYCYPKLSSEGEKELFQFVSKYYNCEQRDRTIIKPYELDIVIHDKHIALEYNGIYWHSDKYNADDYHLMKTNLCAERNYKLIHIFENEWRDKKQIVKNRLRHILGKTKYRIGARQCEIKELNNQQKAKFLTKYHIQGNDSSSVKLGAFYKNRLVAVMTFGKQRKVLGRSHEENCWELIRFCTIGNFTITGIANKLLKYFIKSYNPKKIISYADKRWSTGDLYKQLGFKHIHDSSPNYWYTKNFLDLEHRFKFRKSELPKLLENFDPQLTERQNMENHGFARIYDCGSMLFELNLIPT